MSDGRRSSYSDLDNSSNPLCRVSEMDEVRGNAGIQGLKQKALRLLKPRPSELIVDLGCGSGEDVRVLSRLVSPGGKVWGIDSSRTMIDAAKERNSADPSSTEFASIEFVVGDAHSIPLPDGSVDACRCERLLQHVSDPEVVFQEMKRILRPGGRMVVLDTDWETFIIDSQNRTVTRKIAQAYSDVVANGWIGRQLPRLAKSAGFKGVENFSESVTSDDYDLLFSVMDLRSAVDEMVRNGTLTSTEAQEWLSEMAEGKRSSTFFFGVSTFGVFAEKPR